MEWHRETLGGIFPFLLLLFVWLYRWTRYVCVYTLFIPLRKDVDDNSYRYSIKLEPTAC